MRGDVNDKRADCADVLTQISSVVSALEVVAVSLIGEHLKECVAEAVVSGADATDAKVGRRATRSRGWSSRDENHKGDVPPGAVWTIVGAGALGWAGVAVWRRRSSGP